MSYILDALRKSDQQRRLGAVPTLPAAATVAAAPERPPLLLPGLLALTLTIIVAVTVVAWLHPWSPEPVVVAITAAKPLPPTPQRQIAPAVLPLALALPVAEAPPLVAPPAAVMPVVIAPVLPRKPPAASPAPVLASPARTATVHAGPSAAKALSGEAPQAGSIASSPLPASIRRQLPPLSVAVHAYSDIPQDRLVSINGRMLREGDTLAPDLRLEQITPEGMIFTFRGHRFQRAAQ